MDTSEPSTNGVSASNLYRLSNLLEEESYSKKAKETVSSFESEMTQYPWLFASFMPSIVARNLGVKGVVVSGEGAVDKKIKAREKQPRGAIETFARLRKSESWLRSRNPLFKEFGLDDTPRALICEQGTCLEKVLEDDVATLANPLDLDSVAMALPEQQGAVVDGRPEEKSL